MRYAELQVTSNFSFLRGASSADELFMQAKALGIEALGIVDRNSLAGIVRAHVAAKATGVRLIIGCRLDLADDMSILVYPTDRPSYSRLCRLLSLGKKRGGKAKCLLNWSDVTDYNEGLIAVLIPDQADDVTAQHLKRLADTFIGRAYMALTLRRRPNDALRLHTLSNMAANFRVPTVVTNDVLFHVPERRILQDVVTCIRHNCTIDDVGFRRERHADRYLKPPEEMARLFLLYPEAFSRGLEIAERCRFFLDELSYQYPDEKTHPELTPQQTLEKFTWIGAAERYPDGVPEKVIHQIERELLLINKLNYAAYFLTVHAIVKFARSQDILCQGRGSAANSSVCYVLGITAVNPMEHNLLFERFISENRNESPDIDVDFEHERRETVLQWVFETYGRDHAALCAVVTRYRAKGALRDVGKALGLPEDVLKTMSSQIRGWSTDVNEAHLAGLNLNLEDRRMRLARQLARELIGAPRHLSQHPGGFVLTHDRLDELVPIEPAAMIDRQVIEWDKDDIDALKFMKVDCLALGMLTCMKRVFNYLKDAKGIDIDLAGIPADDTPTYDMICKADTIGVFQIESRAQMSMLPRLKPRVFYDLVIEVAIVRPGPIQGDMVHPYLRRRQGLEKVLYPPGCEELEAALERTLGVPLFQEHAMRVASICAGFTPGEADEVRRSLATFKHTGGVANFKDKLLKGMKERNYPDDFAQRIVRQLEGFGSYGFPESHAISFALLAYASSWMKCHHPDVFCTALINSQPMGFYAVAQLVRDAREHGVEIRPVCINTSRWDCTLEPAIIPGKFAVRLGLRLLKGFSNSIAATLVATRGDHSFTSIDDLWRRTDLPTSALEKLAEADAFLPSLKVSRREALWAVKGLRDTPLPLFAAASLAEGRTIAEVVEPTVSLKVMTEGNEVVEDYGHMGLTLRHHPVSFLRDDFKHRGILTCTEAMSLCDKKQARAAGMVLVRQKPGSANGVMFITIEDETGIVNAVVWPKLYEIYRRTILSSSLLLICGQIQREGDVTHLVAHELIDLSDELADIGYREAEFPIPHGRGDEFHFGIGPDPRTVPKAITSGHGHPRNMISVKSRDFK